MVHGISFPRVLFPDALSFVRLAHGSRATEVIARFRENLVGVVLGTEAYLALAPAALP